MELSSNIVNEAIRTISSQFILFYKNILSVKKAPKRKRNDFHPLRSFFVRKICCLCCLVFAYFCFVS